MLSPEPMSDKSHAMPDGLFALPHHRLMALSGRDAVAFAQAQFMNDVTLLTDGQWQWNGWLTPKGRVVALFALLRVDAETLWLVLPDAEPGPLADALKRYVFRSKVAIAVRDDLHIAGRLGAPLVASGAVASLALPTSIGTGTPLSNAETAAGDVPALVELDMSGDGGPRALYVLARPLAPSPASEAAWAAADLRHGLPLLPAGQAEHWTPQQLSLERLKAFSVKKGCYPGQEIVARTHFLGKVKRGLMLVTSSVPFDAGAELLADVSPLGSVVSSMADDAGSVGLAVVPLERDAAAALTIAEAQVTEAPLLGGLAR
ncbi:YgfZ/GcvT domain-containing protein [Aerolutibacter ruishenii]|uniref:Aminomethyltransferase folate-binding domain-containing protein n=1 Tax=Aerolutibacter ruishenii TaxID=686800 RepID=A0A562LVR3_9GAMM|nr:folate-binding protein YgfZ [Lysobacter ruishenii]TWI11686.1 hypothetical protein IP93_01593 [Lysobacter ruishenii]